MIGRILHSVGTVEKILGEPNRVVTSGIAYPEHREFSRTLRSAIGTHGSYPPHFIPAVTEGLFFNPPVLF
jgi:hypothetical protein